MGRQIHQGILLILALQVLFFPPPAPPFFFKSYVWQTVKSFSRNIFNLQKKKKSHYIELQLLKNYFLQAFSLRKNGCIVSHYRNYGCHSPLWDVSIQ